MPQNHLTVDVLVVGGGTGGTAAAIQCARQGVKTLLVSEFPWLGGMLTSAGVSVPDGNELLAFQTGLWGKFLQELQQKQPGGLDHSWVSFFSFDPRVGAKIFRDWVEALPNLQWIAGKVPREVKREANRLTEVCFDHLTVKAKIIIDGTELGDLLALGEIPHRWGWEFQGEFQEPSAPIGETPLTQTYPVQSPTWVVLMRDFGEREIAPEIIKPPGYNPEKFIGAWEKYSPEQFINYGRLPDDVLMMNWPIRGNDYGEGVERLIDSEEKRSQFLQAAFHHSHSFAYFIQTQISRRYGLATGVFPHPSSAFALHPYYRESRRLKGIVTLTEQDILPILGEQVAALPVDSEGRVTAIAIGNYANDHHYPNVELPLKPKSIRWGGRWTGTPFTIPYQAVIPQEIDGFLSCEKNISVSHIANGATRLQPVVMNLGQAVGMAAALCIEQNIQPRELSVKTLQNALLTDQSAPAAIIPLFNLTCDRPDWLYWQQHYLEQPEKYPFSGNSPALSPPSPLPKAISESATFSGIFQRQAHQFYHLHLTDSQQQNPQTWTLVTLDADIDQQLQHYPSNQRIVLWAKQNNAGNWLLVEKILAATNEITDHEIIA